MAMTFDLEVAHITNLNFNDLTGLAAWSQNLIFGVLSRVYTSTRSRIRIRSWITIYMGEVRGLSLDLNSVCLRVNATSLDQDLDQNARVNGALDAFFLSCDLSSLLPCYLTFPPSSVCPLVFWGGREGYQSLLNTDLKRELDHMGTFFKMAVDYKNKIGFTGQFLIEPKPKEPMKHQYELW